MRNGADITAEQVCRINADYDLAKRVDTLRVPPRKGLLAHIFGRLLAFVV